MMNTTRRRRSCSSAARSVLRLCDQHGFLGTRPGTQRVHVGQVQTTCAEGRRGDVDDVVRGRIELASHACSLGSRRSIVAVRARR